MSQDEQHDGIGGLVAGIALGAVIGAAVALLAAPQSGEQTRQQIRDSAEDALDNIRTSIEELRVKLDDVRSAVGRSGAKGEGDGPDAGGASAP